MRAVVIGFGALLCLACSVDYQVAPSGGASETGTGTDGSATAGSGATTDAGGTGSGGGEGSSGSPECPEPGDILCGNLCVDPVGNPEHCGDCGNACADGDVCDGGACSESCSEPLTRCGDLCVDLQSDVEHCGECDEACGPENTGDGDGGDGGDGADGGDGTDGGDPCGASDCDEICVGGQCRAYHPATCDSCPCASSCGGWTCCDSARYGVVCLDEDCP